ncbi:MAG: hypothetical protein K2G36_12010 [Ruminococcus sp.]|nr:hypothetical protein [Ruminococcus sp.]
MNNLPNTSQIPLNRKYFIVDFNSVNENGLYGIEDLTENDNLIVFFVKGESKVDFSLLSKLHSCHANVTMKEIENKILIPLVISMYIGSISNKNPDIHLVCNNGDIYVKSAEIVSKDIKISLQRNISGIEPPPPPAPENTIDEFLKILSEQQNISETEPPKNNLNIIKNVLSSFNLSVDCEMQLENCIKSIKRTDGIHTKETKIKEILHYYDINITTRKKIFNAIEPYI